MILENEFNKYIDECSLNLKEMKANILPQLEEAIINIKKCLNLGGKIISTTFFARGLIEFFALFNMENPD